MAIALLALIFIAIIAWEVPGLVRKKMWREFAAFSVLLPSANQPVGLLWQMQYLLRLQLEGQAPARNHLPATYLFSRRTTSFLLFDGSIAFLSEDKMKTSLNNLNFYFVKYLSMSATRRVYSYL
jgi:hypothetical protein